MEKPGNQGGSIELYEELWALKKACVTTAMEYLKSSIHKIASAFEGLKLAVPHVRNEPTLYCITTSRPLSMSQDSFIAPSGTQMNGCLFPFYALDLQVQVA